jgi:hypothetical protein
MPRREDMFPLPEAEPARREGEKSARSLRMMRVTTAVRADSRMAARLATGHGPSLGSLQIALRPSEDGGETGQPDDGVVKRLVIRLQVELA